MGGACGTQKGKAVVAGAPAPLPPTQKEKSPKESNSGSPSHGRRYVPDSSYAFTAGELTDDELVRRPGDDNSSSTTAGGAVHQNSTGPQGGLASDPLNGGTSGELSENNRSASTTANSTATNGFYPSNANPKLPQGGVNQNPQLLTQPGVKNRFRSFDVLDRIEKGVGATGGSRSSSKNSASFGTNNNFMHGAAGAGGPHNPPGMMNNLDGPPQHFGSYRSNSRGRLRKSEHDMLAQGRRNYEGHLQGKFGFHQGEQEDGAAGAGEVPDRHQHPAPGAGPMIPGATQSQHHPNSYAYKQQRLAAARGEFAQDRSLRGRLLYYGVDFSIAKKVADMVDRKTDSSEGMNVSSLPRAAADQGNSLSFLWQCIEFASLSTGEEDQALARLANFLQEEEYGRLTKRQQMRCQELTGRSMDFMNGGAGGGQVRERVFAPPPPLPTVG
eukprot:CAMPEP_0178993148 /NCGR_PEP_ID=MMETSP0795-20121207/6535_1 /TAXON_ID=88552 /ORGANISM="Amoebophrya sp., Strain Ameob2" /LENGTH=440 /DNA_ID=CAMNT_0020685161 /DNA_START=235 /DNA_END=1557 /DNA_ORIENTATION=-